MDKEFNAQKSIKAQREYCEKNKLPQFAPDDGVCFSCHEQIYSNPYGIDVEKAGSRLITGCPICRASFLD